MANGQIIGVPKWIINKILALASSVSQINTDLSDNDEKFIFGYRDGKAGYYESEERGADTFHPFSNKPIELGIGTSFDLTSYPNYQNFTVDNFLCEPTNASVTTSSVSVSSTGNSRYAGASNNLYKSYDAINGILTAYSSTTAVLYHSAHGEQTRRTTNSNVHAYLIP